MLRVLDENGDGLISKAEFFHWYLREVSQQDPVSVQDMAHYLFTTFDSDGDGGLTITELKKALDGLNCGLSIEVIADLVRELDADGSGAVEETEFQTFLEHHVTNIGIITPGAHERPQVGWQTLLAGGTCRKGRGPGPGGGAVRSSSKRAMEGSGAV